MASLRNVLTVVSVDDNFRREKEESERRLKEENEKKRLELEEKLRREEEERLARKKRIEEIMARTRGPKTSTVAPPTPVKTNDEKNDVSFVAKNLTFWVCLGNFKLKMAIINFELKRCSSRGGASS